MGINICGRKRGKERGSGSWEKGRSDSGLRWNRFPGRGWGPGTVRKVALLDQRAREKRAKDQ